MARWATRIEIAGIVFTGCRAEIIDGAGFASNYRGSYEYVNNGNIVEQTVGIGTRGIQFGLSMESAENEKVQNLLNALKVAQAARTSFEVKLTDELYTIDVLATTDWAREWFSHGRPASGYIERVVFRFVSRGPII